MSKKARLAKAQRRRDRNVPFYSNTLTFDKIQEVLNEMFSKINNRPKHPLENIIVSFSPFLQKNVILDTGLKIKGKSLLLISSSIKDIFEKMESKVGIRVTRAGENITLTISPLQDNMDPLRKEIEMLHEIEMLQQQMISSVPKQFFVNHDTICKQDY